MPTIPWWRYALVAVFGWIIGAATVAIVLLFFPLENRGSESLAEIGGGFLGWWLLLNLERRIQKIR
ncbi:MAG TPA: hypothetical protein VEK12_15100 [Alphaproteobacteria bacterium]|nr:hypothetical protein [Alphaproteobacteria bacterium]